MSVHNHGVMKTAALVILLAAAGAVAAQEGQTGATAAVPAPAASEEQLMELEEVVVHGERLVNRIINAENEFYKLYNELNKDDRYDVNCPYLNLGADSGSQLSSRVCLPGFVATAIADYTAFKIQCEPVFDNYDANRDGRVTRNEAMVNADLDFQFDELDQNDDGSLDPFVEFRNFETWALVNMNCYRPPSPELVLMEGTDAWYKHMMALTNSDPRLRDMAGRLDDMHQELALVQRRYRDIAGEQAEAQAVNRTPDLQRTGPRTR